MTSYLDVLKELRNGNSLIELSERITEVVAAVRETGKAGTITLELKIKPASKGEEILALMLEEKIKSEVPQKDRAATIFYSTHDNVLVRQDPNQRQLDLRVVDMPKPEKLKEVAG